VSSGDTVSVVLAGGGTAGHVEPALAVADALKALHPGIRITALGTAGGLRQGWSGSGATTWLW